MLLLCDILAKKHKFLDTKTPIGKSIGETFRKSSAPFTIDNFIICKYNELLERRGTTHTVDSIEAINPTEEKKFLIELLIKYPTLTHCLLCNGKSVRDLAFEGLEDHEEDIKNDIDYYFELQQRAQHGASKSLRCVNVLTEQMSEGADSLPEIISQHFVLGVNNIWLNPIEMSETYTWSRTADYRTPVTAEQVRNSKYARSRDDIMDPIFVGHFQTQEALSLVDSLEEKYEALHKTDLIPYINHPDELIAQTTRKCAIKSLEHHSGLCHQLLSDPTYNICRLYSKPEMQFHREALSQETLYRLDISPIY